MRGGYEYPSTPGCRCGGLQIGCQEALVWFTHAPERPGGVWHTAIGSDSALTQRDQRNLPERQSLEARVFVFLEQRV